jgi:hypothetical protein
VAGDFFALPALQAALPLLAAASLTVLVGFALRALWLGLRRAEWRPLSALIVGKTALIWYVGIVLCNSDFDFTVTNVVAHGIPYFVLLWSYGREQARDRPSALGSRVLAGGALAFVGLLVLLATLEEWGWDFFVNHDRDWLFGTGPELGPRVLGLLVPLLAVPQLTHYVLDARLWRSAEARRLPALRRTLASRPWEGAT